MQLGTCGKSGPQCHAVHGHRDVDLKDRRFAGAFHLHLHLVAVAENGIVRPTDIAPDNTVVSSNIADARLEFYREGQLTDAQKRGWFAKLYEMLRPI